MTFPADRSELHFRLKGARSYVQGPDIFDALCEELAKHFGASIARDLRFSAHIPLRHHATVQFLSEDDNISDLAAQVTLRFNVKGCKWIALVNETSESVTMRQEFREEEIVAKSDVDIVKRHVVVRGPLPFSAMEVWVAANKLLHQKLFADERGGWWFAKADITQYPGRASFKETTITLAHNFNRKLTKSRISADGEACGYVYFSARRT
jgi:hypothetical protein